MSRQNVGSAEPTLSLQDLCLVGTVIANPTALHIPWTPEFRNVGCHTPNFGEATITSVEKKLHIYIYNITLRIYVKRWEGSREEPEEQMCGW